ncbi:hypothetical protein N7457_007548 [Penicillium paradoxum]|uniref:uncharacterized protein n=1 Tax=Penicillium paradoxum TaxID=176176 RepID=UPI00254954B2|nr:uncharacterized protein N7457_007548 [Penicillium paradoxum]KAJ5779828.1 hypothetical protein N7457_007548 [Penicillium paradoxum]
MTFRERVKRVFRSSSKNDGKPKIEYYRRSECPPSKFKGPFDRTHQKNLAAWSFSGAMVERTRSFDLSLSPCATYEGCEVYAGCSGPSDTDESVSPEDGVDVDPAPSRPETPAESSPRGADSGSQSSTIINSSSYSGSVMTLLNEPSFYEIPDDSKDSKFYLEESVRYTSPLVRAMSPALSPCVMSARKHLPFAPEDLARALIAVQVCA